MLDKAVFRDKRLKGQLAVVDSWRSCELDGSTSNAVAFAFLDSLVAARGSKLDKLFIMCHGYGESIASRVRGIDGFSGGFGLQLGSEDVTIETVNLWSSIRNKVKDIIVYACAAAEVSSLRDESDGDGRLLMTQLAEITNANVYASENIQYYYTEMMEFGWWDGSLYRFTPKGEVTPASQFLFN